jgi:diguanylate cyclase (GGDEF)-like protein
MRIRSVNRAWRTAGAVLLRGLTAPHRVGDDYLSALAAVLEAADRAVIAAGLRALLADVGAPRSFEHDFPCRTVRGTGHFRLQAARVEGAAQVVVTHTDVTERVLAEQDMAWRASHDQLTGLPNRTQLLATIDAALADPSDVAPGLALLVLDVDGFATVNDSLGHEFGDELLRQVAERLSERLRPGDVVGRMDGDQFVVVAAGLDSAEAAGMAFRLQGAFAAPFAIAGISLPLTASIGVAVAAPGATDGQALVGDADAAMYAAKAAGRDRVHLFSPELRTAASWRLEVATRLSARAPEQLVVHYQPVVRLDTGAVEAVEALLRWEHPQRGLLGPDEWLPVAEETGQLIPITRWLLRHTARQAAAWAAEGLPLTVAVNCSARHLAAETLVRDVRSALVGAGLPASRLVLELTETSIAEDATRAESQLALLAGLGVGLAIDDFGTGWSSLARLLDLPVSTLKIDRSLMSAASRRGGTDPAGVLGSIVSLASSLGVGTVVEGVETAAQLDVARAAGCERAQGWLLARPMPAERLTGWLRGLQRAGGDLCALAVRGQALAG